MQYRGFVIIVLSLFISIIVYTITHKHAHTHTQSNLANVSSSGQFPHPSDHQHTEAGCRKVQHALCYHEPHTEEEVRGGQEGHHTESQPHEYTPGMGSGFIFLIFLCLYRLWENLPDPSFHFVAFSLKVMQSKQHTPKSYSLTYLSVTCTHWNACVASEK